MDFVKNFWEALKKKLVLLLISSGIVFGCWYIMFQHYSNYGYRADIISKIENKLLDLRFLIRGEKKPNSKIGILAIDERSIEQFGRWPFSRRYYRKAFVNLKNLGVNWIGMDAVMSEPEKPSLKDIEPLLKNIKELKDARANTPESIKALSKNFEKIDALREIAPGDRILVKGVQAFENIIMGYFYFNSQFEVELSGRVDNPFAGLDAMLDSSIMAVILPDDKELDSYPNYLKAKGVVANTSFITDHSQHFAFFSNKADSDAIVRWVTQVKILDGNLMPSLSLKLAAEVLDRDILVIFDNQSIESIELVSREDDSDSFAIPIDPLGVGRVLANHRGPAMTFEHFSIADAYNNTFSEKQKEYLKGANLLLGMTAIGINDQRPNPFDPTIDGVENHAAVADNIISQDFLKRPRDIYQTELFIILLIGLIFVPILVFSRALYSGVLVLLFLIGYYYIDKYFWFGEGVWTYLGMPFLEIITLFIVITLYKYVTEEAEKKKVKGAFSHYLSPEVIDQVLDDPESLQLGGIRKDLTVFFSDVRGFTTISESLSPEQLCEFMNTYFTPMTTIILKSGGVLDKYIGDAVMAFWGAPIPIADQADRAAESSILMLDALDELQIHFKEKGFPNCDIGIGLNTGSMSVGNMGSDERFCYTVMGDAVNLGARLEGLTKEYGVKILVSEFTIASFTRKHFFRDLDDIRVKGKNEPVKVFDLMRPNILPREQEIYDLIGLFEEGRKLYLKQDWLAAQKKFEECMRLHPEDGPTMTYLKRIEQYKNQPIIEDWDGVYTFTHK